MFALCLHLKQVSQQSGALWGPGRDSLFLLFSLLFCPPGLSLFWHKLGWHLPAQAHPGPVPALILVRWRSGHGSVTLAGVSVLFPYLSLILKSVATDSLGISQKQGEGVFISSQSSGHFWMHNTCIVASFAWQRGALISDHHCTLQQPNMQHLIQAGRQRSPSAL